MGQVEERLAGIGLKVPQLVPPVAAYVPAKLDGRRIYVSGQVPMVDGKPLQTGKVGVGEGLVSPEDAKKLAEVCALNALAAIASVTDLDKVVSVVKVGGFVAADPSFTGVPGVINGASELFALAFGEGGQHARSAVGVAVLPLDVPVEVDVIVALADD
ncbi:enamine deaminase RidA (YjgF/YER057c/UK114 family) [Kineosphaera limosa]|uniref:Endoribonuclease L-PSP/chorismate mutase-like domain-containing protein n=1 Tax=Kineosphaera limosa NBRC 100340 TaxID=1184609 RepID=K6XEN4_9MICO|nr:RidA family protein [Kineosphaera limosa]NYE00181.1 enamine deaminase RidA (YjgF/YER057c/UK114 family) [Kineosphaera limosa]GAB97279.1 hypothetical protein KILIM_062_00260 [Kineosphaera limosa NBRC 100340]